MIISIERAKGSSYISYTLIVRYCDTASTEVGPEEQGAGEVLSEPELGEGQMS